MRVPSNTLPLSYTAIPKAWLNDMLPSWTHLKCGPMHSGYIKHLWLETWSGSWLYPFSHLSQCLFVVGLRPSTLITTIEKRLSHFLPPWLRMSWQSVISQGKTPWNTPPRFGNELGSQGEQRVRYTHFPNELWWPGPRRGQTVRYVQSPTELSWPGPPRRQTVRYIHSPTELAWPGAWRGQTGDRFILFQSYHDQCNTPHDWLGCFYL